VAWKRGVTRRAREERGGVGDEGTNIRARKRGGYGLSKNHNEVRVAVLGTTTFSGSKFNSLFATL